MRGVTIPVIKTDRNENKKLALFSTQRTMIALSDQIPPRFRFVGIPHGAPPPPLC